MRLVPRIALLLVVVCSTTAALAQAPSAAWRTVTTPHFRVHYPAPYEEWSLRAAARLEAIRDAVVQEVGFAPKQVTDVIVMNPVADPNGVTLTLLDSPRILLYTEAAGPELEIGDYTEWIDLLAVHEVTHLVHLLRPSRNPMQQLLARMLPLDPIALRAPRWVLEGYATVVEGRLTGSGRPTSAMRAAILRRWAQGGRLPTYAQLAANRNFLGMSMAYLAGSAYLEWLEERAGPGSLRKLWARMTARQNRTFAQAFEGVFGDRPDRLYGRFVAELTERAVTIDLASAATAREGELWQETTRSAGDPDVSPEGSQLALVLRPQGKPARIVVLSTEATTEEEAKLAERIRRMLERDPEDVAPVRARPLPRKPRRTFTSPDGGDLSTPRWTPDGRALLYSHRQPDRDGFLHRDLFLWRVEEDDVRRLTHLGDVSDADPFPDGKRAVAVRNRFGLSQLVTVDLDSGRVTPINEPSLDAVYSHPRVSADGQRIAFSVHREGAWRLAIRDVATGAERVLGAEPRTNVVMPEWSRTNATELYATVMERGFIDLHRFAADGSHVAVTRTQGAAFSAAPSSDGRIFFMGLEPDGFVVRTVDGTPAPPPAAVADRDLTPALPLASSGARTFESRALSGPRPYGIGRQEPAWFTGGTYAANVRTTEVGIRLGDVVGRLDTIAIGAFGSGNSPRGFALASAWRGWPVAISAHAYRARGVDAPEHGLELRGSWDAILPRSSVRVDAGGLAGSLTRGFAEGAFRTHQFRGSARADESVALALDGGEGARHIRGILRTSLTLGSFRVGGRYQRDSARGANDPLQAIAVGGIDTSIVPRSAFATRVLDPALDPRTLVGRRYEGRRGELGFGALTAFWQGHNVAGQRTSLAGIEYGTRRAPTPIVKAPALDLTVGVARLLDEHRTRAWLAIRWRP
jgi:hypothetical protein